MPWRRTLVTGEGVDLRSSRRIRAGSAATQQVVIIVVGLFVALWVFDGSRGDGPALLTFGTIVALACLAAWYVRLPDD